MTDKQGKQKGKLTRCLVILNANADGILVLDINLLALMVLMGNTVAIMNANEVIQQTNLSGKTNTKKVNVLLMGMKGFTMAQVIMLYAKSIGNEDMEAEANISFTDLTVGTETQLLARNTIIHTLGAANVTSMIAAGFRIATGDPAAYATLICNWNTSVPSWISAKSLRVAATNGQEISYKSIVNDIMPELRKFLKFYNTVANKSFYDAMENAIKGSATATRKLRAVFTFVDAETLTAITKVTTTLTLDLIQRVSICSKKGISRFSNLSNGVASLDSIKPGCHPIHLDGLIIDITKILRITIPVTRIVTTTMDAAKKQRKKGGKSKGKKVVLPSQSIASPIVKPEALKKVEPLPSPAKKEIPPKKKK